MKPANLDDLKANCQKMAARIKLMSHPERLLMLCRLDEGEASVSELVELSGLSQSAVSQQLAPLHEEGVVGISGEAQTRFYSLLDPTISAIMHALCDICQSLRDYEWQS